MVGGQTPAPAEQVRTFVGNIGGLQNIDAKFVALVAPNGNAMAYLSSNDHAWNQQNSKWYVGQAGGGRLTARASDGTELTGTLQGDTVTATDTTGAAGAATFSWTVNPGGGGCTGSGQLLGNPGFETGTAAPWTASPLGIMTCRSRRRARPGRGARAPAPVPRRTGPRTRTRTISSDTASV